ncbi:MAG: exodeoxyribonuclease VII small subunit [Tannerella sp.]|jgi:exodeoxyribonuclease VII small subunit|nr:exodeoxyribonuclease VII small subunit [Tannerella sp.]
MEKEESYAESFARLRTISDELEQSEPDVDVLSERIEEAGLLAKRCREKLFGANGEAERTAAEELQ